MFSFILKSLFYLIMLMILIYYYSSNKLNITSIIIIIFSLNIYLVFLYLDYNILYGVMITGVFLLIEKLYYYIRNYIFNNKNINKEIIFIKNGIVNFKELVRNNYSYDKLQKELKRKDIKDISRIEYCIKKDQHLIVFQNELINSFPISLMVDGKIIHNNLLSIKKDQKWLNGELYNNNLMESDISYAYYKDGKIYFITNM